MFILVRSYQQAGIGSLRAVEAMEPGVFDHSEEEGLAGQAKGTCLAIV